jgi:hypothetical protein
VIVWTRHVDFSGHGASATGFFFRRSADGWLRAPCSHSVHSDPQAGPNGAPMCGAWTPVPADQTKTLDGIPHGPDVICAEKPDTCAALGLAAEPIKD